MALFPVHMLMFRSVINQGFPRIVSNSSQRYREPELGGCLILLADTSP